MGGREDSHEDGGAYGERLAACALAEGGAVGRGWRRVNLGGRCHEREREKERERESATVMYMPLLHGGNGSHSARRPWWKGVRGEVGLVRCNGAFRPGGLGIDSYLY
jgi:hypothetical protein